MSWPVRIWRLPWSARLLACELFLELLWLSLALRVVPFRRLARLLGQQGAQTPPAHPDQDHPTVLRVAGYTPRLARLLPWRCACLPQAMAAKRVLVRRGYRSTLYLGVRKDDALEAHAWLRYGNRIVTGKREMNSFTPISSFA
ncbi:MAG: lasso peptide biosynthesis B2 protein [Candidatus Eremiobacteraeota bacterium]|nr:lasso peptide biosynthesis B2 protein [Candidatus Eremiobacteraeota bacterium]